MVTSVAYRRAPRIAFEAVVVADGEPAGEPVTEAQRVIGLRPSRYCPGDRRAGFAGVSAVEVTAVAAGRLPLDDHERGVVLG